MLMCSLCGSFKSVIFSRSVLQDSEQRKSRRNPPWDWSSLRHWKSMENIFLLKVCQWPPVGPCGLETHVLVRQRVRVTLKLREGSFLCYFNSCI